jgi:hypothetical protein
VRLAVVLPRQVTVGTAGFSHRTVRTPHQTVVFFSPQCHLELVVRATVPGAPDSPACGTGQSSAPRTDSPQATLFSSLGLHLIFIMSSFEVLLSSMPWSKLL